MPTPVEDEVLVGLVGADDAAARLWDLDVGMWTFLLVLRQLDEPRQLVTDPAAITAYREILRYQRTNPYQLLRCGLIVMKKFLVSACRSKNCDAQGKRWQTLLFLYN